MGMIGPPSEWSDAFTNAKTAHTELIDKSSTWANYLKTKLDTIATEITEPTFTVPWGTITGSVPVGWGAAFSTPTAPTSTTQTGSAVAAVGADGTFDALVEDTVPAWSAELPATPGELQSLDFGTAPVLVEATLGVFAPDVPTLLAPVVAGMSSVEMPTVPELPEQPTEPDLAPIAVPAIDTIVAPTVVTTLPENLDVSISAIAETTMPTLTFTVPDAPDVPFVSGLVVDELQPISLLEFSSTEVDRLSEIVASFSYTPETYLPTLKSGVVTAVESVLGGSPVIGAEVFGDIFTSAADDLTEMYLGDVMQAGNTCGMLGELPSEALLSRVDMVTTKHRQGLQKVRISTAIEQAKTWRDDFWKGVDAAQAFEQLWSNFFTAEEGRRLQAASAVVEAEVAIYNTKVARFNAALAQVQADIAIAAEHRQRALLTIEEHKERLAHKEANLRESDRLLALYQAQLQGVQIETSSALAVTAEQRQLAIATLEEKRARHTADIEDVGQRIAAYQAQIQAASARTAMTAEERAGQALLLDAYRAQLTGLEIELKASERDIALFQAKTQGYQVAAGARTSLFSSQVQATGTDVEQQKAIHAAAIAEYQAAVQAYQAQVQALAAQTSVAAEQRERSLVGLQEYRARVEGRRGDIEAADAQVKAWLGQWDGYTKAVNAETTVFAEQVRAFSAGLEQRKAKLSGDADRARTLIERETAITQRFSAEWQAIAQKAQATLASMQTSAIPAEISIKSEEGRQRGEAQVLQLALANAQNELTKGVETAKLRLQQVQFAAQQGIEVQKTIATLMAHTMGSYLSAGSITYGASASSGYNNSNSYGMTHEE